ncbi:MAG: DnaD domain protein [Oscillospiraceae bacterium]|nr:DnaD domain protein [Oscillospiraceae bacterium]
MGYTLNPSELAGFFAVPCSVVDKHIKLAGAVHLKVLLWALRHMDKGFDSAAISEALKIDLPDVSDSLRYWADAGVLLNTEAPATQPEATQPSNKLQNRTACAQIVKPTREEVAKRGFECPEIAFLLNEAQLKFGRGLRQNESSTLVWLYDDEGMSVALILMLLEFAISENHVNIGFIERTAVQWINDGINNVQDAEKKIVVLHEKRGSWRLVESAMGIEHRSPSEKELQSAYTWVNEWKYGRDILRAAYEQCVDTTSKFSFPYIRKIIETWHRDGVKTIDDIKNVKKPNSKPNIASHDMELAMKNLVNKK